MSLNTGQQAIINLIYEQLQLSPLYPSASFDLQAHFKFLPSPPPADSVPERRSIWKKDHPLDTEVVFDSPRALIAPSTFGDSPHSLLELEALAKNPPDWDFERWDSFFQASLFMVPPATGEAGSSLYHEFKWLSALVHADPSAQGRYTLVRGSFPGIQRALYSITADRAAKGVRGRSFFLQLLAECVVRRLLAQHQLPMTNALSVAGGKFLLLLPPGLDLSDEKAKLNQALFEVFDGDYSLTLCQADLDMNQENAFGRALSDLFGQEKAQKSQPFADISWENLFEIPERHTGGSFFCKITQQDPLGDEQIKDARNKRRDWLSPLPTIFVQIAEALALQEKGGGGLYLLFAPQEGQFLKAEWLENFRRAKPDANPDDRRTYDVSYAGLFAYLTGWSCKLSSSPENGYRAIALNPHLWSSPPTLPVLKLSGISGVKYLAAKTPITQKEDVSWLEKPEQESKLAKRKSEGQSKPNPGRDIRDFELLAGRRYAADFQRLGLLRMDVDGLGKVFTEFGKDTPTRYIAASHTMSLFFDGYVSQLCQAFENEYGRSDSLYIIYGGGDDLFIVGEWDLLPHLAQKIHDDFAVFTQERHSISAAIVLIQADDPFHRAAAEAGAALDAAKGVSPEKNRLYFLGEAFTWRDGGQWQIVVQEQKRLLDISKKIDRPQAITRHLTALYNTWARDLRHRQHPDKLYYGPYLWRAAYQLKRLQEEYDKQGIKGDLQELQANLIKPETMGLSGVIARWAELYIRATKKEN